MTPQDSYRKGLANLDAFAQKVVKKDFVTATEDEQDGVLLLVSKGEAEGFDHPKAKDFFKMVRKDTIHGLFSDPLYGGNRDKIGWKLVGYLGAQRAWTETELSNGPNRARVPQGLMDMHHSHPGQPGGENVIHPVAEPDPRVHT
jgi:gluconate 2-dehydrogenase gamma chain